MIAAPHVEVPSAQQKAWDTMVSKMLHVQMRGLRHVAGYVWLGAFGLERPSRRYQRVRAAYFVNVLRGGSKASVAARRLLLDTGRGSGAQFLHFSSPRSCSSPCIEDLG